MSIRRSRRAWLWFLLMLFYFRSVETTLNVYSHATDEGLRTAAKTIDKTIGSLAGTYAEFEDGGSEDEQVPTEAPKPTPRTKFEPYKDKYRRQGTGSIHQMSKNVWEGRYSPNVNGTRIIQNVYASSIEECEEKLAELIATMNAEIAEMKTALHA